VSLRQIAVAQFSKPQGALGRLAGLIMATRPSNRARNQWTVNLLDIGESDRVLEFGCGPGYALAIASARAARGSLVGVDHSATMVGQAARRNRPSVEAGRMEFRVGGLECLAEFPASFDKLYSVNVVQFLPDRPAAFRDFLNVLRPGGVVATAYMPRHRNPTRADALAMADSIRWDMEVAGFDSLRVEELPLQPVPAICVIGRRPPF
jgi:trans-aconitate methyltransferase